MKQRFFELFGATPTHSFSAPGRTEIGGNHTDHQGGRVLAAAVNLDTRAAVRSNGSHWIRLQSEGYPLCQIDLTNTKPVPEERGTTAALIRGVAAWMTERGCPVSGFDAYVTSDVLPGSGLSSSAAFEVLIAAIISHLSGGGLTAPQLAQAGQYAENVYFGKPCGLMDQMASAVGGLVAMDFSAREPLVRSVDFDFSRCSHSLCIIDTGADHADLTDAYSAIPADMGRIAGVFGKQRLSQLEEQDFYAHIVPLRKCCGDRAVLRAIHYYEENQRVDRQVAALERGDFGAFLALVNDSGRSSWEYLQNVLAGPERQEMGLTLALCRRLLNGRGACRVHGGGFAGTVQAFVPEDILSAFCAGIEGVLGQGSCHVLQIRPTGAKQITME
ncbi:MAG: galactokinase [Oscillospiraceae bacterium]|nr:galactokinase [Oscillospiraceae bacterium]